MKWTHDEIERRVLADYTALVGRAVLARTVDGYVGSDSYEFVCDPPAVCRVLPAASLDCIRRWHDDEWCDPVYDLELLETCYRLEGVTGLWCYGTSYSVQGGVTLGDAALVVPDAPVYGQPVRILGRDEEARGILQSAVVDGNGFTVHLQVPGTNRVLVYSDVCIDDVVVEGAWRPGRQVRVPLGKYHTLAGRHVTAVSGVLEQVQVEHKDELIRVAMDVSFGSRARAWHQHLEANL